MHSRFHSQLIARLRRRSSAVSGLVLLCLVGQAMFPGVTETVAKLSAANSDVVGCCVVNLSRGTGSGCCCGPTASESCGCACGTKKSAKVKLRIDKEKPSGQSRMIQSEICGCGGSHRPGMITSLQPAVLPPIDEPLLRHADSRSPDSVCDRSARSLAPPTPPPELCA